jgi:hypothetical protein
MKLTAFPESFLSKMSPEDRRAIGQPTMAEAEAQYQRGQERELKRDVLNWLNLQGCMCSRRECTRERAADVERPIFSRVCRLKAVSSRSSSR